MIDCYVYQKRKRKQFICHICNEYIICVKVSLKEITVHYVKQFPSLLLGNTSKRHHVSLIVTSEVRNTPFKFNKMSLKIIQ